MAVDALSRPMFPPERFNDPRPFLYSLKQAGDDIQDELDALRAETGIGPIEMGATYVPGYVFARIWRLVHVREELERRMLNQLQRIARDLETALKIGLDYADRANDRDGETVYELRKNKNSPEYKDALEAFDSSRKAVDVIKSALAAWDEYKHNLEEANAQTKTAEPG